MVAMRMLEMDDHAEVELNLLDLSSDDDDAGPDTGATTSARMIEASSTTATADAAIASTYILTVPAERDFVDREYWNCMRERWDEDGEDELLADA